MGVGKRLGTLRNKRPSGEMKAGRERWFINRDIDTQDQEMSSAGCRHGDTLFSCWSWAIVDQLTSLYECVFQREFGSACGIEYAAATGFASAKGCKGGSIDLLFTQDERTIFHWQMRERWRE